MNAKDAIRQVIEMGYMLTTSYVSDLTDEQLLIRSVPGANHIAWQLGHLVSATSHMLQGIGQAGVSLPPNFDAAHAKEAAGCDEPGKFCSVKQYLGLLEQSKAATLAAVDAIPDADLDKPGPESMREYAPTLGTVLLLLGEHPAMHCGQFIPVRRKLGKPAMF